MRARLAKTPAFAEQKSAIEQLIESRGHLCMFTPKFHPELAWIELYWAKAKRCTRARPDRSWTGLKTWIWKALGRIDGEEEENINSLHRQRFARKTRDFVRLYAEGATSATVDLLRKMARRARCHRSAPTCTGEAE